jgi:tetratricopeptide (TPR) repeat protein
MISRMTFLFALGLAWCGLGCVQNPSLPNAPPPNPQPKIQQEPVITKQAPKKKRPPKADTYIAWGSLCEQEAEDKDKIDPSRKMNLYDEARKAYQTAIKADPKCLAAYSKLAQVYMKMDHYDRALETYRQALDKCPKEFSLWLDMGMCYCRTKEWDLAVASFKKGLEKDPENRQVLQTLGFCLARAGRTKESFEALQKIMSPAQAHFQIARMLHHVQRDDLCREELGRALLADPGYAPAQGMLASLDGPPPTAAFVVPAATHSNTNVPNRGPHIQIQFEE